MDPESSHSTMGGDMTDSGIDLTSSSSSVNTSQENAGSPLTTKKYVPSEAVRALQRRNGDIEYELAMRKLLDKMDNLMEKVEEVGNESQSMLMKITELNLSCHDLINSLEDISQNGVSSVECLPTASSSQASQQSQDTDTSPSLSQTSVQPPVTVNEEKVYVSSPRLKSPSVCSTSRSQVVDPVLNLFKTQNMIFAENAQTKSHTTFMTQVPVSKVQLAIDEKAVHAPRSKRTKKTKGSSTDIKDSLPKWNATTKVGGYGTELPPIKRKNKDRKKPLPATDQKLDIKAIKTLFKDQLKNDSEISLPQVPVGLRSATRVNCEKKLDRKEQKATLPSYPIHTENLTTGAILQSLEPMKMYPALVSLGANEEPACQHPKNSSTRIQKDVENDALNSLPPILSKVGMAPQSYMSQRTGRQKKDNHEYDFCVNGLNAGKGGASSSHNLPPITSKAGRPQMPNKNRCQSLRNTSTQSQIPTLPPISPNTLCKVKEPKKPKAYDTWRPKDAVIPHVQNHGVVETSQRKVRNPGYQKLLPSRPMRHRYM